MATICPELEQGTHRAAICINHQYQQAALPQGHAGKSRQKKQSDQDHENNKHL